MISAGSSGQITMRINFPDCWDGQHLDSPDHKSHMAYSNRGGCPASHPVVVPQLVTFVRYDTPGGSGVTLASGAWYTFHADFFNAWHPRTQEALIDRCIHGGVHCGRVRDA
jgi:hypothetical protein